MSVLILSGSFCGLTLIVLEPVNVYLVWFPLVLMLEAQEVPKQLLR